jgi:D-glycero-D-manno-heptose 1,7-bisphosphate phosphatase
MNRGLLLDRDGVINADHGYVGRCEQFEFMPGVFPFLKEVQDRGYRLAILTNQAGVARGFYSAQNFEGLTAWMLTELGKHGVTVDLVLGCFEHPEGIVPAYSRESYWRKPNPGMVLEALQRLRLDPARSAFLGDQLRDLAAAAAGGIRTRLLLNETVQASDGVISVASFNEALKALIQVA